MHKRTVPMCSRKVPLWGLLLALVVILCCTVQICAEVKLHRDQRAAFIQSLMAYANAISQNLSNASLNTYDSEEIHAELVGARLRSEQLYNLLSRIPEYTVFGSEKSLFDELYCSSTSPDEAFAYVKAQLNETFYEYQENKILSAESLSIIIWMSDAFSSFYDSLDGKDYISQKSFIDCMDTLCTTIQESR